MDELLRAGFAALGLPLDAAALARFQTYYTLLDERSKVMNLTAIHGETDVAQLHFLDSAALLTVEPLAGKSVIDVGTGAGFPGLPLKIAQPDISLTLLDSLDKRVRFLGDVCAATGLTDVTCLHTRAEEAPELRGQGVGLDLLKRLAAMAVAADCGRMEWNVLDWNNSAKGFYEMLGARHATGWETWRLEGDALKALGAA